MPKLVFHDSEGTDRTIDLGAEPALIGRATECQVQTQDAMVSRRHARIVWDGGYWIEDLGSSNGVFVAGERVQRAPLRPNEEVRCGSLVLKLLPDVGPRQVATTGRQSPLSNDPARRSGTGLRGATMGNSAPPPPAPPYGAPPTVGNSTTPPPAPPYGAPPTVGNSTTPPPAPPYGAPPPAPDPPSDLPPPEAPREPSSTRRAAAVAPAGGEAERERARREQAESAVLDAEQRAATAEGKLFEFEQQVAELRAGVETAERQATAAMARAKELEAAARDGEKHRRQVDQLKADLRRLRGGAGSEDTGLPAAADPGQLVSLTDERDRLRQRVADLEAELAGAQPSGDETALLKRRIDQLSTEVRRLRGGQPADDGGAKIAELESRLAQAERERDAALARPSAPVAASDDVAKLKRMVEQLTTENRRLRAGAAAPAEDPRVAELTAKLAQAEQERDAARRSAAAPSRAAVDPAAADAANAINDALADLRGSLRACSDEVGVLGVEAPGDSVTVLKDALASAGDQLENARGQLRELKRALGVS